MVSLLSYFCESSSELLKQNSEIVIQLVIYIHCKERNLQSSCL